MLYVLYLINVNGHNINISSKWVLEFWIFVLFRQHMVWLQ